MTPPPGGLLVVLSGPSGVGKDSVLARMRKLDPSLRYSVSFTTRAPRPGEVDGVEYSFVDEPSFRDMVDRGAFLEWAEVHGNLYGTSMERVSDALEHGEVMVLKIDVQGAERVRGRLGGGALFVFLVPPSMNELRDRLHRRDTDARDAIERRLDRASAELAEAESYDHRVVNDDVGRAAGEVLGLIRAHRELRLRSAPA